MNTNESTVSTGATYTTQMDAARKWLVERLLFRLIKTTNH